MGTEAAEKIASLLRTPAGRAAVAALVKHAGAGPLPAVAGDVAARMRMTKQANPLLRALRPMFTRPVRPPAPRPPIRPPAQAAQPALPGVNWGSVPPAPRPPAAPRPPGPPREFSPGRSAATLGLAVPTGLAANRVLQDDHNATAGRTANPYTWFNPRSHQDVFNYGRNNATQMRDAMQKRIADAYGSGDFDGAQELMGQLGSGDFTTQGFGPALGGLNPFAGRTAKGYADIARGVQTADAGRYDAIKKFLDDQGKTMPETARAGMRTQLGDIDRRMKEVVPYGAGPAVPDAGGDKPYGGWTYGRRPLAGGQAQGYAVNPHDYRAAGPLDDVVNYSRPLAFGR